MTEPETLSRRRRLRFWGWGYADEGLTPDEEVRARAAAARYAKDDLKEVAPPTLQDFDLPAPRIAAPPSLAPIVSASPYDRLTHAYGKSFPDVALVVEFSHPTAPARTRHAQRLSREARTGAVEARFRNLVKPR